MPVETRSSGSQAPPDPNGTDPGQLQGGSGGTDQSNIPPSGNDQSNIPPSGNDQSNIPPSGNDHTGDDSAGNAQLGAADLQRQMLAIMKLLSENLVTNRGRSESPSAPSAKDPDPPKPEFFRGDPLKLNDFIFGCNQVFKLQASRYTSDDVKITYMTTLLRDGPLSAVQPYSIKDDRDKPDFLLSYDLFVKYLQRNFGDQDQDGTAWRSLYALTQTGSASTYFSEFNRYVAILGWSSEAIEPVMVRMAMQKLKPEILDDIARYDKKFTRMSDLVSYVVSLDNRLFERERARRLETVGRQTTQSDHVRKPAATPSAWTPLTNPPVKAPVAQASSAPPAPTFLNRISEEEKQRRRVNNDCLYCGEHGHYSATCPVKAEKFARMAPRPSAPAPQPAQVSAGNDSGKD